jgi:hypothetical protein
MLPFAEKAQVKDAPWRRCLLCLTGWFWVFFHFYHRFSFILSKTALDIAFFAQNTPD